MTTETTAVNDAPEDPWADAAPEDEHGQPQEQSPFDGDDPFDEFDDILNGLSETEDDKPVSVPSSATKYRNPYDAGLKHLQWVAIRILAMEVDPKHDPRFKTNICVAEETVTDPATGKPVLKRYLLADQIEEALGRGATEVMRDDLRLPYFVGKANHARDDIERSYDWDITVPVYGFKMGLNPNRQNNGKTGYASESGSSLRKATHATTVGEEVTPANRNGIAKKMVETIVLAQLNIVQSKSPKYRDVLNEEGQRISVLLDPTSGGSAVLMALRDGEKRITGYVKDDGSGEVWDGDTNLLVPIPGETDRFAILDQGEMSGPLQEKFYQVTDYLRDKFLPLPERAVTVTTVGKDGKPNGEVAGEITLDTIGAIAQGATLGTYVDVFLTTGLRVTAFWGGTKWQQVPAEKTEGEDGEKDQGGVGGFRSDDPVASL